MSRDAIAWLAARTPAPPPPLLERLREALAGGDPGLTVPAALAEAGIARLQAGIALGEERAAAYELLAADALLSYAFEAAAEAGMPTVAALVEAYGPARIAPLLAGAE